MRKNILYLLIITMYFSCTNGKVDEKKLDNAGEDLQKSVKKAVDTAGAKLKKLEKKMEKSDSANN